MNKISAAIITFNEERDIERCLNSLIQVVDEIVVVDSYSTDNTEEICKKYNVRFMKKEFSGYGKQKRFAVEQCKYDYVLSLDADEALSDELKTEILKLKENFDADGYIINRLNYYCGKWLKHVFYPDRKLRLWNKKKGNWNLKDLHEEVELEENAVIKSLKGNILHFTYYNLSEQINQINKFSSISAKIKFERGKKIPLALTLFRVFFTFIKFYFFKRGFLDGYYGFVASCMRAFETFLKDIKLQEYYRNKIY